MPARSPTAPDLDVAGIVAAYRRFVRQTCPAQAALADRLLERLAPARWVLEWHLPWWLGHAVGLDPRVAQELALSNVFGLGSIRLGDDLADDDVAAYESEDAAILSDRLYEAALRPYRVRFDPSSTFWAHLDATMRKWRAATAAQADDVAHLAARGAPLKISAYAVCLLADRMDVYADLEPCLDLALEGMVRYDHVADWQTDLAAGRWNAFVEQVSELSNAAETRERRRKAVLVAMLTTEAVAEEFARIDEALSNAAGVADQLPVAIPELAVHLREFAAATKARGASFSAHYRELGDRAAELLRTPPIDARSLDGN